MWQHYSTACFGHSMDPQLLPVLCLLSLSMVLAWCSKPFMLPSTCCLEPHKAGSVTNLEIPDLLLLFHMGGDTYVGNFRLN